MDEDGVLWTVQRSVTFTNLKSWPLGKFTNSFILEIHHQFPAMAAGELTVNTWESSDPDVASFNRYCRAIYDEGGELVWMDSGPHELMPPDGVIDPTVGELFAGARGQRFYRSRMELRGDSAGAGAMAQRPSATRPSTRTISSPTGVSSTRRRILSPRRCSGCRWSSSSWWSRSSDTFLGNGSNGSCKVPGWWIPTTRHPRAVNRDEWAAVKSVTGNL